MKERARDTQQAGLVIIMAPWQPARPCTGRRVRAADPTSGLAAVSCQNTFQRARTAGKRNGKFHQGGTIEL